jgi:hypothetical protein
VPNAIVAAAGGVDVAAGGVTAEAGGVALGAGGGSALVPDAVVPHWQTVGQAVVLRSGKARTAGSTSEGHFTLKHFNTGEALVLGLLAAQPATQGLSPRAQASAQL